MQVCSARDHRQRFVAGIAAHGSAQRDGMPRPLREKPQISTVGVVHQKRYPGHIADPGQRSDILHPAEVIRAGDIDAEGLFALLFHFLKCLLQLPGRNRAATQRPGVFLCRPEPPNIKIQQCRRIKQRLVGVACCQQHRATAGLRSRLQRQKEHGADTLRGAFCTIESMRCTEKLCGVGFALCNDALCFIQLICTADLGDIQRFKAQNLLSLMAGHMQPGGPGLRIAAHKVHNGRSHAHSQASPSAQALQVLPSSMGTSMPCAASS